jgi:FK506-binding protein 1
MVILARAVFKFEGAQADDLSFDEDDVITVLQKDESGWWTGRNEQGQEGDFPFNYVELLDERETQAYLKKKEMGEHTMNFQGERVDTIEVIKANPPYGGKPASFVFESSTTSGAREQVTKGFQEIRAFDAALRTVLPDFDGKLPPAWADNAQLSDKGLDARKEAMEFYVQKLGLSQGADFLLVPFLFPGKSVELSADSFAAAARAQQQAKEMMSHKRPEAPPMLVRAEYAWEPQDPVELSLEQGEVLCVISQSTGSEGWWEGQNASGTRGLFPFNHVELLAPPDVANFLDGKPLSPSAPPQASPVERVKKDHIPKNTDRPVKIISNFTIATLPAFDDMIDKGVAVENMSGGGSGPYPKPGDRVELHFRAHIWDNQTQAILEFLSSDDKGEGPLEFVVNDDSTVCQGLHVAIQKFPVGASGRIIIAPKMGYGVAGSPPVIPPLAHLIYDVNLINIAADKPKAHAPKQKPEVKARSQSTTPRVLSIKMLQPIANRPTQSKSPAKGANDAQKSAHAQITANPSVEHHTGARRAGHVMVGAAPPSGASQAPRMEVPKFDLKDLQVIVRDNKIAERGLNRAALEDYLTDKAFFEAFLMDRGHFLLKPLWRQQALKRAVGLF